MELIDVSGATGYLDTDYRSKGRAAVGALEDFDAVVVHIEAPDEAGHLGDAAAKVRAIEMVDEHVVGPIRQGLAAFERSRILIAPDHPTPVGKRVHTGDPPPFCMAGAGIEPDGASAFTETAAVQTGFRVDPGHTLMDLMLRP